MTDEELLDQSAAVPTMYFDGFGAYRKVNGVLRCIGYVIGTGAQLNLVIPVSGASDATAQTQRVLAGQPTKSIVLWDADGRAAH